MPSEAGVISSSSVSLDPSLRVEGQVEAAVDRRPERGQAEVAERHPELQRAAAAGELQAEVGEVHLAVPASMSLRKSGEISKPRRSARRRGRAAPQLDRLVEPFVRVERDRVGELHAGERLAAALAEAGEGAVGAVDVEPDAMLAADLRELAERVDRARGRGAGVRDHHERLPAAGEVGGDRAAEGVRADPRPRSVGITRTWSGRKPSARAARASDECVWSDMYTTARSSIAPIRASRAQASAVRLAADPPDTSTPAASSG